MKSKEEILYILRNAICSMVLPTPKECKALLEQPGFTLHLNEENRDGYTILDGAAKARFVGGRSSEDEDGMIRDRDEIIATLKSLGAKVGQTTIRKLISTINCPEVFNELLKNATPEMLNTEPNFGMDGLTDSYADSTILEYAFKKHNEPAVVALKSYGAKTFLTTEKIFIAATRVKLHPKLFDLLLQEGSPQMLNEPVFVDSILLERVLQLCDYDSDWNGRIAQNANLLRAAGAKTIPTVKKLACAAGIFHKNIKYFEGLLEDASQEMVSVSCSDMAFKHFTFSQSRCNKALSTLVHYGNLLIGSNIDLDKAIRIAEVIQEKHLVAPVTFTADVKSEVKDIIDAACKLTKAEQDQVISQCGGALYTYEHLVYMLFDQLVAPEHHACAGALIIDGRTSTTQAEDVDDHTSAPSAKNDDASVIGGGGLDDLG